MSAFDLFEPKHAPITQDRVTQYLSDSCAIDGSVSSEMKVSARYWKKAKNASSTMQRIVQGTSSGRRDMFAEEEPMSFPVEADMVPELNQRLRRLLPSIVLHEPPKAIFHMYSLRTLDLSNHVCDWHRNNATT